MPQCHAKSKRSGEQCKNYAIRGMTVCKFHGGILGGKKAQRARKIAPMKHGHYTKEAIEERKEISKMLKEAKDLL